MKRLILPILANLWCLCLIGQDSQTFEFSLNLSPKDYDNAFTIEQTSQGDRFITTFIQTKKDKLVFLLLENTGQLVDQKIIDFPDAKVFKGISLDEQYLLVGSKRKKGKFSPAIWTLEKTGENLKEQTIWTEQISGQLLDIGLYNNIISITGELEGQMTFLQMGEQLKLIGDIFQPKSENASAGNALAIDQYGKAYITGFKEIDKRKQLTIWKFDKFGVLRWDSTYYHQTHAEGKDIMLLSNWDIAVLGVSTEDQYMEDALFLQIAPNGEIMEGKAQVFKTPNIRELPTSIVQTDQGNLLLIGASIPFGGRLKQHWYKQLDNNLSEIRPSSTLLAAFSENQQHFFPISTENYLSIQKINKSLQLNYHRGEMNLCEKPLEKDQNIIFQVNAPSEIVLERNKYLFKGKILSKEPIGIQDILLIKNTIGIKETGEALDEIKLTETTVNNNHYCYELEQRLNLGQGYNQIFTRIQQGNEAFLDTFLVNNRPKRPNLFILSIGIASNLEYTGNDAQDFIQIFESQEERLFENVYSTMYVTREDTEAWKIRGYLQNFKESTAVPIETDDVLLVFVSSHGQVKEDVFYLQGSDFKINDPNNDIQSALINFKEELLEPLEAIQCKKILFVDACKSGKIKGEDQNAQLGVALNQILAQSPGIIAKISSSSEDQVSYENGTLQNGVFTFALEAAFSKQNVRSVDTNHNSIISLGELYGYLKKKVPEIASKYNNGETQNPKIYFPQTQGKSFKLNPLDFPIYFIPY